jgi:hypothetical protein
MVMSIWKKVVDNTNNSSRIGKMDKPALLNWLDTSLMELGGSLDKYRFHNGDFAEVTELINIVNELHTALCERIKEGK